MSLSLSPTNSPRRVGTVPGFLSAFLKLELRIRNWAIVVEGNCHGFLENFTMRNPERIEER
jgi:hypothetical protein